MTRDAAHRAGSALLALALLVAPVASRSPTRTACVSCAPGCPMHARRVGCHHAQQPHCHRAAPATGLRSACRQPEAPAAPGTSALRGVMPARLVAHGPAAIRRSDARVPALTTQQVPEPPTDPPRAPVLPS